MPLLISVYIKKKTKKEEKKKRKEKGSLVYIFLTLAPAGGQSDQHFLENCIYVACHFLLLWLNPSALWQLGEIVVYHSVSQLDVCTNLCIYILYILLYIIYYIYIYIYTYNIERDLLIYVDTCNSISYFLFCQGIKRNHDHCGKLENYTWNKENCLKMVSGKTPTEKINYTEIARNANLKNSKGMPWLYYLLQVNNGKVFQYDYYVFESNFPKELK